MISAESIEKAIRKTGYILESYVTDELARSGWSVIPNRYYIDDVHGVAREIDLVAYKSQLIAGEVTVCTTLIISCKKNDTEAWVLFERERNLADPNIRWFPVTQWTNSPEIMYYIRAGGWEDDLIASCPAEVRDVVLEPTGHVFAFQLVEKSADAKPKDDKQIFKSIESLLKATAYEIASLEKRKTDKVIYQFNLLNVVDAEMYIAHCKGEEIDIRPADQAKFVYQYIVNRSHIDARLHFIHRSKLLTIIPFYSKWHECFVKYNDVVFADFVSTVLSDAGKRTAVLPQFHAFVRGYTDAMCKRLLDRPLVANTNILPVKYAQSQSVEVVIDDADFLQALLHKDNEDQLKRMKRLYAMALFKVFHYSGLFDFGLDDLPF